MKCINSSLFLKYSFPHRISFNECGSIAAFVVSRPSLDRNTYLNELWVLENNSIRSAFQMGKSVEYIWEDEKNILFLDKESNNTLLLRGNIQTGKVETVQKYNLIIREFAKIGSNHLVAICLDDVNVEKDDDCVVIDELPYCKNGIKDFISKKRNTIYILNFDSGTSRRITPLLFQTENYCIQDSTVYFNGSSYDKKINLFQEIWSFTLGDEHPRCIYQGREYNMRGLAVWNHKLIMLGNTNPNIKLFHSEFYQVDTQTGEVQNICQYDHSTRSYVTGDGAYGKARLCKENNGKLYFISTIENRSCLMSLDHHGTTQEVISREGAFCDFDISGNRIVFTALWDTKPLELYETTLTTPCCYTRLSHYHDAIMDEYYTAKPVKISYYYEDQRIDGWVLLPQHFNKKGKYPALLNIHGGPNAVFSEAFSHEMQVWTGLGFIVFFCNPVGSEGRGDDFMNIHGDFGGTDYRCLMSFTDEVLKAYPQIDENRLCVTGGSYGGFMTNWIVTHTNRFAAAAVQRGISNWITTTLLCDNGWYNMPPQMKGNVFTGIEKLWDQSPLKYINNATTPTLILHSELDFSVPIEEGMQMFTALKDKGVDAKLIRFKGETHELSRSGRPRSRIRRIDEISKWMLDHTKKE